MVENLVQGVKSEEADSEVEDCESLDFENWSENFGFGFSSMCVGRPISFRACSNSCKVLDKNLNLKIRNCTKLKLSKNCEQYDSSVRTTFGRNAVNSVRFIGKVLAKNVDVENFDESMDPTK